MDRIALQILEDGWEQDGRAMRRAVGILKDRLAESTDGRWAAAAFEINRIYNILEKAFERLCESFENHLEKTGRYHDTLIERVTLELKGIRPAFLPADAVREVRELKGFRHLFRHAYDLDLDPVRVTAAAENAAHCVDGLKGVRTLFRGICRRTTGTTEGSKKSLDTFSGTQPPRRTHRGITVGRAPSWGRARPAGATKRGRYAFHAFEVPPHERLDNPYTGHVQ